MNRRWICVLSGGVTLLIVGAAYGAGLFSTRGEANPMHASSGAHAAAIQGRDHRELPAQITQLPARTTRGLAWVAREVLRGAQPPKATSFPRIMQQEMPNEVMVLVREDGRARIWRSAQKITPARSLLHAAITIRDRWNQRIDAFGGTLQSRIGALDVEVWVLERLQRIEKVDARSLRTASQEENESIGFEYRNIWRYVLPEQINRPSKKGAYVALLTLLEENDVPAQLLGADDLRVFQFRGHRIGTAQGNLDKR